MCVCACVRGMTYAGIFCRVHGCALDRPLQPVMLVCCDELWCSRDDAQRNVGGPPTLVVCKCKWCDWCSWVGVRAVVCVSASIGVMCCNGRIHCVLTYIWDISFAHSVSFPIRKHE